MPNGGQCFTLIIYRQWPHFFTCSTNVVFTGQVCSLRGEWSALSVASHRSLPSGRHQLLSRTKRGSRAHYVSPPSRLSTYIKSGKWKMTFRLHFLSAKHDKMAAICCCKHRNKLTEFIYEFWSRPYYLFWRIQHHWVIDYNQSLVYQNILIGLA